MLDLSRQLALRKLVCPVTREPLIPDYGTLRTLDGTRSYPVVGGVPILLPDPERYPAALEAGDGAMVQEYASPRQGRLRSGYRRLLSRPGNMRTEASHRAFEWIFADLPPDALCLSIGGGPLRVHAELVNLNLGAFPNVDIVADAHRLPYADGAVERIHCEAVLEHLEVPGRAVEEMFRVLVPGGRGFVATPFLQPYHGYPDHFQNFTLSGHRRLFERVGFTVLEAGTCVGPTFALRDLLLNYLREVVPGKSFGRFLGRVVALLTLPALYLDRLAQKRGTGSRLASSTYLKVTKPAV
jgi:SAM-dependent methyltransferase